MNNARFIEDKEDIVVDATVLLRQQHTKLTKLVEAIDNLSKNKDWHAIKELLFDGQIEKLEKALLIESKNLELNVPKIQRLNGNLEWAKRFDLYKLAETYKVELNHITKKLNDNA